MSSASPTTVQTVLVVDDDPRMVRLVAEMLRLAGYNTLEAHSPEQAVVEFQRQQDNVDLLLSDVTMPGMSGRELRSKLWAARPDLVVILMSGDHTMADVVLYKPFGMGELHSCVARALQGRHRVGDHATL